jgi:hypothetical protein
LLLGYKPVQQVTVLNTVGKCNTLVSIKVKVKQSHYRPEQAQRVGRGIALLFRDLGAKGGGWSASRPGRFTPGKEQVPTVQEADNGKYYNIVL